MRFDPAVEAQAALRRAQQSAELGEDCDTAFKAEEIFSAEMGEPAQSAYQILQEIGERHPEAVAFHEFLIYLTWQQVMAEPLPIYFQKGAELCDRYLNRHRNTADQRQIGQIRELRASFQGGLGLIKDQPEMYDEDTVKGGD
ncbi:MAG: hypothetical protein L0Y56_02870 [Nitrospira sp.]|nr:hypothetical protein [Nitrospira sp.]